MTLVAVPSPSNEDLINDLIEQAKREQDYVPRLRHLMRLQEILGCTQAVLAGKVGMNQFQISEALRLSKVTSVVLELVEKGNESGRKLPISTAFEIARLHQAHQDVWARRALDERISAPKLRKMYHAALAGQDSHVKDDHLDTPQPDVVEVATPQYDRDVLGEILDILIAADQSFSRFGRFSLVDLRNAFENEDDLKRVQRRCAYVAFRLGELDELIKVIERTKFPR